MIEDKQKALEAMKRAGELALAADEEADAAAFAAAAAAAWNQKKLALDLCTDSLVPYDQMLAAYKQGLNILKH